MSLILKALKSLKINCWLNLGKLLFMRRILSLFLFTFIVAIGLAGCSRYDEHVEEALAEIAMSKNTTSLSELTPYEWDKLYVTGPYQSFDCSVIKGVPKKVKGSVKYQEFNESSFVLLFTLNQKFVSYSEVRSKIMDELGVKNGVSVYTPEAVIPVR